jgi:cell division protein FtsQ
MPKPARRRFSWRVFLTMIGGLLICVTAGMAARRVEAMLIGNERFVLESGFVASGEGPEGGAPGIHVEGNRCTSRDRIVAVFLPDYNKSIFHIPLAERRRRLLAIDWIEDASVMRILPNQLIVHVRERHPVAFAKLPIGVAGQYRYLLIDGEGVLLSVPRQRFDFPVLAGVTEEQTDAERRMRVTAMQNLFHELGPAAASTISGINAESPLDLRVASKINGRQLELWLGEKNYRARFENFTNHFDEILRQSDGASVFDLRLDGRVLTVR